MTIYGRCHHEIQRKDGGRAAARPRSALLLAVLLTVAALTPLTHGATYAQSTSADPLPAPRLTATPAAGAIELRWNAVAGAAGYDLRVWWSGQAGWQRIGEGILTGSSYTHRGLTTGRTYHYIAAAVDGAGARGAWSQTAVEAAPAAATSTPTPTATPTATPTTDLNAAAPSLPSTPELSAQATASGVVLSWNAVPHAARYELLVWWSGATDWQPIGGANLTGTAYTHDDVSAGTTYHYTIRALNASGGAGAWLRGNYPSAVALTVTGAGTHTPTPTPTASATPGGATPTPTPTPTPTATASTQTVPAIPQLSAQATASGVVLSWNAVPHAVRYELLAYWDGGIGWQPIGGANLTGTAYTHDDVVAGTTYHYTIRALNASGASSGWLQGNYPAAVAQAVGTPTPTATVATTQRGALVALYEATGGADWSNNENWLSDKPLSTWYGVRTDGSDRVIYLDLPLNGLSGPLPDLRALTHLSRLDLKENGLTGPFPELRGLARLRTLLLHGNQLSGPIPALDGEPLVNLAALNLNHNRLSGPIPDLSALVGLRFLSLNHNRLSGPVPDLGAYFQLYSLELAHNRLTGPIPDLSAHIRLQWLDLSNNLLTGPVPPALADLPDLADLYLAGNRLSGCIPPALHRTAYSDLDRLALPDCAAPTPTVTPAPATTQRGALVALYHATGGPNWRHNNNWLSDKPLDAWYGVRAHPNGDVIELHLGNNRLTGEIPDLSALAELRWLRLGGNYLTGEIPDFSANARLRTLHLGANRLTGSVPPALNNLSGLISLSLNDNQLSGPIPDLSALANLEILVLSGNRLTGPVPDLSANPRLKWLYLDNNQLTGPVPDLSALVNLTHLHLSHNRLTGPVPDLSALTQLWELYLSHNALTGSFPDLSALVELRELHLNSNRLSGEIPDLSALTHLDDLYLGFNRLSGPFPDLSALTNLETVYLRDNFLSGPVLDLGNLVNLRVLLSENNDLSGPLPDLGALLNLAILDLAGNRFCLPAGVGLSHPSHDVADHLRSLDLPACSAAELALVLPAPRNLTATVANGRVDLSWDAAANAAAYELQVWDSLDRRWASAGGLLTATSYSHPVLGDGRNYYFQVRARNAAGVRGPWTERVHAIIVPQRFPPPPRSLGLDILYQKYMVVVDGIFVAAPSDVSDEQMIQAGEVLTSMLSARPDLLQAMADLGTSIFIYFETLPSGGKGFFNFSANLSPNTRYCGTTIHEYAHLVHDELRERPGGPDFDARLLAAYKAALDADLYGDAYASSNMFEYWAEMVTFWFQGQVPLHKAAYGTLLEYDPQGAQLVEEVFGAAAVPAYCKPPRPE